MNEKYYLIDCGEGAQMQLRKQRIKVQRIEHIFITHLHGDHFYGLIGLITSMHLLGRNKDLHIHTPPHLKEIIDLQLSYSHPRLNYKLFFHEFTEDGNEMILDDGNVQVTTIPLDHRVHCCGFLFREIKKPRTILKQAIQEFHIPANQMPGIKNGDDFLTEDGTVVKNEQITLPPPETRSFAYCCDTAYKEDIVPMIEGIDLLYHEATFMEDMKERAKETHHSTTIQAATIAQKANVKELIIGHYSARYKDLEPMLEEARTVFKNTSLGIDGEVFDVEQVLNR